MNTTLENFRKTAFAMTSALLVGAMTIPACSSGSSSTVTCGAGTTKQGDQCVGVSDDGGLVDASSEAGSDAGGSSDGNVAADAPPDGDAAAYSSDPCPTDPIEVNCSSTCGGAGNTPCASTACKHTTIAPGSQPHPNPYALTVLRTPDHPSLDQECKLSCDASSVTNKRAGIRFGMALDLGASLYFTEVRVGYPWWIGIGTQGGYPLFCPYEDSNAGQRQGCMVFGGEGPIVVWTDDPNAPSRNVYIRNVPDMAHGCQ